MPAGQVQFADPHNRMLPTHHETELVRADPEATLRPAGRPLGHLRRDTRLTVCTLCTILGLMSTAYVSGRVPLRYSRLVVKQARAAKTSKSNLVARYVIEKTLESEFPGIAFRGSLSGREAYVAGHRVAVWEVVELYDAAKSVAKAAEHFDWPPVLVKRALAYAKAFPEEIQRSREGERHHVSVIG